MILDLKLLESLWYVFGFLYSLFLGNFAITHTLTVYYTDYEEGALQNWRSRVIGLLERSLYIATSLAGFPEFIAIWLALKVAGQWERWKQDWSNPSKEEMLKKKDTARVVYMGYLLGNGLSIGYSLTAVLIINLLVGSRFITAAAIALSLPIANLVLYLYIKQKIGENKKSKPLS